jgi:ABC-type glycerol-3-phosphate transport system substrate-binding protein
LARHDRGCWRHSTACTRARADKAFPQGTLDYFKDPVDGHYYGAQVDTVWTPIVYYNKDIFDELGLSEPTTWDEFYALTAALADAGYIPLSAVYDMQLQNHLPQALMLRSWTQEEYDAFSQNWSGSADPATFEHKWTDQTACASSDHQDMADHDGVGRRLPGADGLQPGDLVVPGPAGGRTRWSVWEADASVGSSPFNVDWFYYPPLGDQAELGVVGSWPADCVIAFQDREHVAEAKQFISYLISPEGMEIWAKAGGLAPGRTDLSPELLASALGPNTVKIAGEVATLGSAPLWEAYIPPELFQGIRQHIDLMLAGSETPEEVAAAIEELNVESRAVN